MKWIEVRAPSLDAIVKVAAADASLATAIARSVARALDVADDGPRTRVVRLRTRKRLRELGDSIRGAVVVVRVTESNARRLAEIVSSVRAGGAAGVQLVWDGYGVSIERHVFSVLEEARSTPASAPVVLSTSTVPEHALRLLVRHRTKERA